MHLYVAHSTHHACASKNFSKGPSIEKTLRKWRWKNDTTFQKYYHLLVDDTPELSVFCLIFMTIFKLCSRIKRWYLVASLIGNIFVSVKFKIGKDRYLKLKSPINMILCWSGCEILSESLEMKDLTSYLYAPFNYFTYYSCRNLLCFQ